MFKSTTALLKLMSEGGVEVKEKKDINVQIGRQIKKAREAAGYTQDGFAELIQMGTKNVSAIERGLVGVSTATVRKICKALFIASDTLIMDEPDELDIEKLDFCLERMRHLSKEQYSLALDIINKLFEVFALEQKERE